jgi:hypothetical protein
MFNEKLELRKEMKCTYLVQRLEKPRGFVNPFSFGGGYKNGGLSDKAMDILKSIMSFDYMGSAEFEWGAVPAAFQFLAEQASKGNILTGDIATVNGKHVYYLSPKEYCREAAARILKFLETEDEYKLNLKEHCGLREAVFGNGKYKSDVVGWLEIDNGFMFFTDVEMYQNVCKLFGINA